MRATVDLPHPDSPTIEKVVPRGIAKDNPSTAFTIRAGWRSTVRSTHDCGRLNQQAMSFGHQERLVQELTWCHSRSCQQAAAPVAGRREQWPARCGSGRWRCGQRG